MSRLFLDIGDGLELRRLDMADAENLQVVIDANRERLRMWMWWAEGSTLDTTRTFIEEAVTNDRLDPLGITVDSELVGVVGATPNETGLSNEIGYWIAASHEGQGFVSRSCSALIDHLFSVVGCHRVLITVAMANARSRAIPERLGFRQEGVLREAHRNELGYHDVAVYGMLEHEWIAS